MKHKTLTLIFAIGALSILFTSCGKKEEVVPPVVEEVVIEEIVPVEESATEDAVQEETKTVRKKKTATNPMSMIPGGADMDDEDFKVPTREELEKAIDEMLLAYRSMPAEQKTKMLEMMKQAPAMMAMQKYQMKQQFDKASPEDKEKAKKMFPVMRATLEEGMSIANSKLTDTEKKELAPMIDGATDMINYAQELINGTAPEVEKPQIDPSMFGHGAPAE